MVVHAFYVRHLLPIWFDVQVLERHGGTAPAKSLAVRLSAGDESLTFARGASRRARVIGGRACAVSVARAVAKSASSPPRSTSLIAAGRARRQRSDLLRQLGDRGRELIVGNDSVDETHRQRFVSVDACER